MNLPIIVGDMVELAEDGWIVGFGTNVGWDKYGNNIMGAGAARVVRSLVPNYPRLYGRHCQLEGEELFLCRRFLAMPSKPLAYFPHLSWKGQADARLVRRSLEAIGSFPVTKDVNVWHSRLAITLIGTGLGGLRKGAVLRMIDETLQVPLLPGKWAILVPKQEDKDWLEIMRRNNYVG